MAASRAHSPAHIIAHFLHVCMSFGQNYWLADGEGVGDGVMAASRARTRVHVRWSCRVSDPSDTHMCFFFLSPEGTPAAGESEGRTVQGTERSEVEHGCTFGASSRIVSFVFLFS